MASFSRHSSLEPFPWGDFKEWADSAHVGVELAEELLGPEILQWSSSRGIDPPDESVFPALLRERLLEKVDKEGLSLVEAALYCGMTEESFRDLLSRQV